MAQEAPTTSTKSIKGTIMSWTEEKDVVYCREILVSKLFNTKKSSPERGQLWNDIADALCQLKQPIFRVYQKSVRDHYNKLVAGHKRKMRDELNASGISPEQTEIDKLLEEIVEQEAAREAEKENIDNKNNRRMEVEKVAADDMRRKDMEAQTTKRKTEERNKAPNKKRRSIGGETIAYLQEKTEIEMELRKEEMELKRAEVEFEKNKQEQQVKQQVVFFEQQGNMMHVMIEQQQRQQQQIQAVQMLMTQQQQQQSQALIALLDKLSK